MGRLARAAGAGQQALDPFRHVIAGNLARRGATETALAWAPPRSLERQEVLDLLVDSRSAFEVPGGLGYGAELSGGQWQSVARALVRDEQLLLVADEPASALNATVEHALLVSHRYSAVGAADIIVVLDRGRVAELFGRQARVCR
ncbi:hypothetical protein [Actinokineospora diospyrosa]|uniref:ABC transporter family protein n=1 Tax=Actinokineospora diospyrosa TaxID=103728 RepID=A0ABT1IBZ5_9PSEU|nr:hypothetical protein [Actinokineospora diospyrosa]MCP2270079.1 hypothetical protein [Actinokineospora diospyrosa]